MICVSFSHVQISDPCEIEFYPYKANPKKRLVIECNDSITMIGVYTALYGFIKRMGNASLVVPPDVVTPYVLSASRAATGTQGAEQRSSNALFGSSHNEATITTTVVAAGSTEGKGAGTSDSADASRNIMRSSSSNNSTPGRNTVSGNRAELGVANSQSMSGATVSTTPKKRLKWVDRAVKQKNTPKSARNKGGEGEKDEKTYEKEEKEKETNRDNELGGKIDGTGEVSSRDDSAGSGADISSLLKPSPTDTTGRTCSVTSCSVDWCCVTEIGGVVTRAVRSSPSGDLGMWL